MVNHPFNRLNLLAKGFYILKRLSVIDAIGAVVYQPHHNQIIQAELFFNAVVDNTFRLVVGQHIFRISIDVNPWNLGRHDHSKH